MPHDVVIVGGGHNGLTAAAYLARAGTLRAAPRAPRPPRRRRRLGAGVRRGRRPALALLLPREPAAPAHHRRPRARRAARAAAATRRTRPTPPTPTRGLLVDREADAAASAAAFARVGADGDAARLERVLRRHRACSPSALFPTVTEPLPTRAEARELVGDDAALGATSSSGPSARSIDRALRERPRARRRRDRRPDRHVHRPRRSVARREPLLPVPRDRRRHRRLGRAGRRHGRRDAASSRAPRARPAPSS